MDDRISIAARDGDSVSVSTDEDGVWLSVFKFAAYASTPLTREQAVTLRDAIDTILGAEHAAQ